MFSLRITYSGMQKTGFTGLISSYPRSDKPATPNNVWNGSACKRDYDNGLTKIKHQ